MLTEQISLVLSYILVVVLIASAACLICILLANLFYSNQKIENFLNKNNYNRWIVNSIFGIAFGSLSFIFNVKNYDLGVLLFISSIAILGIFLSHWFVFSASTMVFIFLISRFLTTTQFDFNYENTQFNQIFYVNADTTFLIDCAFLILASITSIAFSFLKKKNNLVFLGLETCKIALVIGLSFALLDNKDSYFYLIKITAIFLFDLLLFSIMISIKKMVSNVRALDKKIIYEDNFINEKYSYEQIYEVIKKQNLTFGLVVYLNYSGLEKVITIKGANFAKKLKLSHMKLIKQKLTEKFNAIFFISKIDLHYCFIPLKKQNLTNLNNLYNGNYLTEREDSDFLKLIEEIIKKYDVLDVDQNLAIRPEFKCMIYGVHSTDLRDIVHSLELNKYPRNNELNQIVLLNPTTLTNDHIKNKVSKSNILVDLDMFDPMDIQITFDNLNVFYESDKNYIYANAILLKKFILVKEELYTLGKTQEQNNAIISHISALSIKKFLESDLYKDDSNVLVIDYPYEYLKYGDDNVIDLFNNLSSYNIAFNKIILNILFDDVTHISDQFIQNLNYLKYKKISYGFWNLSANLFSSINYLKPKIVKISHGKSFSSIWECRNYINNIVSINSEKIGKNINIFIL